MTKLTLIKVVFFFWLAVIVLFSVMPVPGGDYLPKNSDKFFHFLIYFITAFFFYYSFRHSFKFIIFFSFLFSSGFGFLMEVIQYFIPGRNFSSVDIIADISGAGIFVLFCALSYRMSNKVTR